MTDLGYFDEYGGLIISIILFIYTLLYIYLTNEYHTIDE